MRKFGAGVVSVRAASGAVLPVSIRSCVEDSARVTRKDFGARVAGDEYAMQFVGAIQSDLKVKRNEKAIAEAKRRLVGGGS